MNRVGRPRRSDVAASYDRGAVAYEALWSPVILPPAAALVWFLGLQPAARARPGSASAASNPRPAQPCWPAWTAPSGQLAPQDFAWEGEVICAVASAA